MRCEVTPPRHEADLGRTGGAGVSPPPPGDPFSLHQPRAPGLGAPPSYLEAGLWRDRLLIRNDTARLQLNQALRVTGDEVVVPDPVTGIEARFTAEKAMLALIGRISTDPAEIDGLPDPLRERLAALGVLVDGDAGAAAHAAWERTLRQAMQAFREGGHAELSGLLCPAVVAFLRQRYRHMARHAALPYGDPQCPTRWIAHNEAAARPLHQALTPIMSAVVGEPVKPSYLYLGAYAEGSTLPRHTDREQCAFTLSLLIDYLPDIEGPSPWPLHLHLDGDGEPRSIRQRLGQGLIFRGREIAHSRPALPAGHMSISIFFHFVPEDFRGRID